MQQLVGGIGVAVKGQLLQGAAEEERQAARAQQALPDEMGKEKLRQSGCQGGEAASVLLPGRWGKEAQEGNDQRGRECTAISRCWRKAGPQKDGR